MNRFHRTELLLGPDAMQRLRTASVTVAGLGGVGSYAAEALARAGVGHLRLIDADTVNLTNINRQLYALDSTLGQPKVELAAARIRDINPACSIEALKLYICDETLDEVLAPRPDVLIDAIDTLSPKVALLERAVQQGVPCILSSMGAGNKTDPGAVRVADLSATRHCRLARFLRKRLRRRGIHSGILCVYSEEETGPVELPDEIPDFEPAPRTCDGRIRAPLGSTPWLPPIFGLTAAAEAVGFLTRTAR
jgi:tRNA A37 threonylcarbamoyladenosine dehydratase